MKTINSISKESLMFGHFGNGILVVTKEITENNDYMKLAHIDIDRNIHTYKVIPAHIMDEISNYVKTANPTISISQDALVFNTIV